VFENTKGRPTYIERQIEEFEARTIGSVRES
jgi:hypothetical protein